MTEQSGNILHQLDPVQRARIDAVCPGWSHNLHWVFFREVFQTFTDLRDICILGVYFGRDIAYMAALLEALRPDGYRITGVDKFSGQPCADWRPEQRGLTWEEAGFGPAPSLEAARSNLERLGLADNVRLVQSTGEAFLEQCGETYDFIYIDTSHDYETTVETILRAVPRLRPKGLLAGDDFADTDTWGVARAVRELCPAHHVLGDTIWYTAGADCAQD